MPELETRFAQIPDWLNYNQPPVPSFLQTRQDNREQMRSGREERALQMREELQPLMVKDQELQNATAKAALDYTMQTREAETKAALLVPQIEKLEGGWGSIEAITLWQNEVLKNPAIANSKVGELIGRNIGTALQYGKTLEDAKRRLEFEQQRNALTNERYRLNAEQWQNEARDAKQGGRGDEVNRRFLFGKQLSRIQKQIDNIDKNQGLSDDEKRAQKDPLLRQQYALENAFGRGLDLVDALEGLETPEPAPQMDEAEQIFANWKKNIRMMAVTGQEVGRLRPDGTIGPDEWGWGDKTPAELLKEVEAKEAAYRGGKPATSGLP
jgi:hypothetical protein